MTQKIAVAVIHGIGKQQADFANNLTRALDSRCRRDCGDDVVVRAVHWAPVMETDEEALWNRVETNNQMRYKPARRFLIDFLADAFAYQIAPKDRAAYDAIHAVFAATLKTLAKDAGEKAPLCVIAHSLGSVIASNFIYDLQTERRRRIIPDKVRTVMDDTPLERGETLALLYTMGSPIALWSLRFSNFGKPVQMPDPRLKKHYPRLKGEWINFYDADDLIGFPLKTLNQAYSEAVTEDREVNVGSLMTSWNPLSHFGYWTDNDILDPIASKLIDVWKQVNLPVA